MKKSEFGKGFIYSLGLYMMHLDRVLRADTKIDFIIALDDAYDHLRELNIPNDLPKNVRKDIVFLLNRIERHKHNFSINGKAPKDKERIVNQSRSILYNIDKYYLKINPIRGEFE